MLLALKDIHTSENNLRHSPPRLHSQQQKLSLLEWGYSRKDFICWVVALLDPRLTRVSAGLWHVFRYICT